MGKTSIILRFVVLAVYLVILVAIAGSGSENNNPVSAAGKESGTNTCETTISISAEAVMSGD